MFNGFFSPPAPHAEQRRVEGNQRSIRANVRPVRAALYSSMFTNMDQPTSCTERAMRVRASPATLEVLHIHRLVVADNARGFLVEPVPPRAPYLRVSASDCEAGLYPVL